MRLEQDVENNNKCVDQLLPQKQDARSTALQMRSKIWQIVPIFCGSLINIPYGLMLGWPSPTYPKLLLPNNPIIPITLDQSAMIAGFLMLGNIIALIPMPIWKWRCERTFLGAKYGLIAGNFFMLLGWLAMWWATNIYWLLVSRLVVGFGYTFGIERLRNYIREIGEVYVSGICFKSLNVYVFIGVLMANVFHPYRLHSYAFICICITAFILVLQLFLPHSPAEYVRFQRLRHARRLIQFIYPTNHAIISDQLEMRRRQSELCDPDPNLFVTLKDVHVRRKLYKLLVLTFFQQFTGLPPAIVYTQIILGQSNTNDPQSFAILIALGLLLTNLFAINQHINNLKLALLFSTGAITLLLASIDLCLYFNVNDSLSPYTFLFLFFTCVCLNAVSLAIIPINYVQVWIPKEHINNVKCLIAIFSCFLAIIATKTFQLLMTHFGLVYAFFKCTIVAIMCFIYTALFIDFN